MFGLVCGTFTLASHLRGTDIFLDMIDDPDYVRVLIADPDSKRLAFRNRGRAVNLWNGIS